MKITRDHKYSDVESFEDLHYEKERLIFRSKLIEAKLHLAFIDFSKVFSFSNLLISVAKKFFLPKISDLLGFFLNKEDSKS
jgi:hypothetical protein